VVSSVAKDSRWQKWDIFYLNIEWRFFTSSFLYRPFKRTTLCTNGLTNISFRSCPPVRKTVCLLPPELKRKKQTTSFLCTKYSHFGLSTAYHFFPKTRYYARRALTSFPSPLRSVVVSWSGTSCGCGGWHDKNTWRHRNLLSCDRAFRWATLWVK